MKKIVYLFAIVVLMISCNKENLTEVDTSLDMNKTANIIIKVPSIPQYDCIGGGANPNFSYYNPNGYYFNHESGQQDHLGILFSDLYLDLNASGTNNVYVNFGFKVYGVDSNEHLSESNANNFHNEVLCRIIEILDANNVPYPFGSSLLKFKLKSQFSTNPDKYAVVGYIYWD